MIRPICLLALVALAASLPPDVQNGFFPGRSGNVILKGSQSVERGSSVSFVDKAGKYFDNQLHSGDEHPLSALNFADVVNRALGVEPMNDMFVPEFLKNNIFERPRASLTIAVDGVGAHTVSAADASALKTIRSLNKKGVTMPLADVTYPSSSLSLAATLATGKAPAQHGIVGAKWSEKGRIVEAFSSAASSSAVANSADFVSQTFAGKALVLSASADAQFAAAFCAHPELTSEHPEWRTFCLALDDAEKSFKSIIPGASDALGMTQAEIRDILLDVFPASVRISGAEAVVSVGGADVRFSLDVAEDYALFAEVAFAVKTASALASEASLSAAAADRVPDYLAFVFASYADIAAKYGSGSPQAAAALELIDKTIAAVLKRVSDAYGGEVVTQLVLLGDDAAQEDAAVPVLRRLLPAQADVESFLPSLYLPQSPAQLQHLCSKLSQELSAVGLSAFCPESEATALLRFQTLAAVSSLSAGNSTSPTDDEVQRYQVAMWVGIGLVVILFMAVYSLAYMDFRKDTMIYGTINPHWETKRRR